MQKLLSLILVLLASSVVSAQELRYEIRLNRAADDHTLAVEVSGSSLRGSEIVLNAHLPNWGDWADLGRPYLRNVTVNGRPAAPSHSGTIPLGTGRFVLRYELPVLDDSSTDAQRLPLLPRGRPGIAVAAVRNTLVVIRRGNEPVAPDLILTESAIRATAEAMGAGTEFRTIHREIAYR